jgi:hypothetical protein
LPEDEVLTVDRGAYFTLDDGVFDLHATPHYIAIRARHRDNSIAIRNLDRIANF